MTGCHKFLRVLSKAGNIYCSSINKLLAQSWSPGRRDTILGGAGLERLVEKIF